MFAAPATWCRLVRIHRWRRVRTRVHPSKPKKGLRASKPDEIWYVDTSVVRLINATKVYLHAEIDNYSRKILAWCVATKFDVMNTVKILREAASQAVSATSTPKLLVDGGSENLNANVDELIGEGLLSRVIALKDIQFSNSLIETLWRTMKHQWLFLHPLETPATVSRLVVFYVPAYNGEIPHAAFKGQTPMRYTTVRSRYTSQT